jgi:hypothetical protein
MSAPNPKLQVNSSAKWTELRDENGKLCARLDARGMVLEIRRSDRKQIARFDLREYMEVPHVLENKKDIE